MKKTAKALTSLLLSVIFIFTAASCARKVDATGLWENAVYLSDTEIGEGQNTFTVKIEAGEQAITLTVKTDMPTVGQALFALGVINHQSFFDTCNGIVADWDKDSAYWAFWVKDAATPAEYGVDDARSVTAGASYRLVYTV